MQTETPQDLPINLDVYIDFVCPWCYLAHGVVEQLQEKHKLKVNWLPFPLHPDTPPEGLLLSELFKGANVDSMHKRLYELMDELELPYSLDRDKIFNTLKAQELLMWAKKTELSDTDLLRHLFKAYFVDKQNLADETVLLNLAESAGLDREEAAKVLSEETTKEEVELAWQQARQFQINGVPAFVAGGFQFSGFQPLVEMERFIQFVRTKEKE